MSMGLGDAQTYHRGEPYALIASALRFIGHPTCWL